MVQVQYRALCLLARLPGREAAHACSEVSAARLPMLGAPLLFLCGLFVQVFVAITAFRGDADLNLVACGALYQAGSPCAAALPRRHARARACRLLMTMAVELP